MFIRYSLILVSLLLLSSCCQYKVADKHEVKQDAKSQNIDPERSINNTVDNINRGVVNRIPPKT
jgi:hypothetical protein